FILSTEIYTTFLFLFFMVMPLFFIVLNTVFHAGLDFGDNSLLFSALQALLLFFVLIASFRRFYSVSFLRALLASLVFIVAYFVTLFVYRQLVFVLVMLFI